MADEPSEEASIEMLRDVSGMIMDSTYSRTSLDMARLCSTPVLKALYKQIGKELAGRDDL